MLRWSSVLAALAICCWLGAAARADDLSGKWKIEGGVRNGEKIDKEKVEKVDIEVTKDKITLTDKRMENENKFVMTYKTKEGKPNSIEMTIIEGPIKDISAKGIYELKGDTLKLCYNANPGGDAPTAFESKADSQVFLWTLKKAK
jgi:uncharacterized protein (TIGR03067 family)